MYLTPPLKGFPVEFCIGAGVARNWSDGAFRMSKKFSDRFSRFDTMPECDSHPASHVAVAITLNAKAPSLKIWSVQIRGGEIDFRKEEERRWQKKTHTTLRQRDAWIIMMGNRLVDTAGSIWTVTDKIKDNFFILFYLFIHETNSFIKQFTQWI